MKIDWKKATETCRPVNYQDEQVKEFLGDKAKGLREFKYAKWYSVMVITKDGTPYCELYFEDGKHYTDFKENDRDYNFDVMRVENDEGYFRIPWTQVDKWCYTDELIESVMEDAKEMK